MRAGGPRTKRRSRLVCVTSVGHSPRICRAPDDFWHGVGPKPPPDQRICRTPIPPSLQVPSGTSPSAFWSAFRNDRGTSPFDSPCARGPTPTVAALLATDPGDILDEGGTYVLGPPTRRWGLRLRDFARLTTSASPPIYGAPPRTPELHQTGPQFRRLWTGMAGGPDISTGSRRSRKQAFARSVRDSGGRSVDDAFLRKAKMPP